MKKFISLVLVFLAFQSVNINAQRLDRESLGTYKYTQLPINPILVQFHTYRVEGEGQYSDAYRRDAVISATNIAGFEKKGEGADVDMVVKVEEYPLRWSDAKQSSSVEKYKVDGVEKSKTVYSYSQSVTCKYVLKIYNRNGESIYSKEYSASESFSSGNYDKSGDAYNAMNKQKEYFNTNVIPNSVGALCRIVNDEVGFPVKSFDIRTALIKPKKFTYEDFDKSMEFFNKGIAIITAKEDDIEAAGVEFKEAIAIWEKMLTEANLEDRKARIDKDIATLLYLNIALCHTMLKDYPKAIELYTKGQELDKNFCAMDEGMKLAQEGLKRKQANEPVISQQ